jgi:hypothetical protein
MTVEDRLKRRMEELRDDQRLGYRIEALEPAMGKFFEDKQGPL